MHYPLFLLAARLLRARTICARDDRIKRVKFLFTTSTDDTALYLPEKMNILVDIVQQQQELSHFQQEPSDFQTENHFLPHTSPSITFTHVMSNFNTTITTLGQQRRDADTPSIIHTERSNSDCDQDTRRAKHFHVFSKDDRNA